MRCIRYFVLPLLIFLAPWSCRSGTEPKDSKRYLDKEMQDLLPLFPIPKGAIRLTTMLDAGHPIDLIKIANPRRVLLASNDHIYISDAREKAVFILGASGSIMDKFGNYGQGSGQFLDPLYISECSDEKIAVLDSRSLKVQLFNSQGSYLSSFRIFKPCFSMASDTNGSIYMNLFDSNRAPLISVFDESGRLLSHFGSRIESGSSAFNEVEMAVKDDGVFVAWRTFPVVRKYSRSGALIFEHYIDYGPFKQFGDENKAAVDGPKGVEFKNVSWKICAGEDSYYLLIAYPRLQILQIDFQGKLKNVYWDDTPSDFYASDFYVRSEGSRCIIGILVQAPVPQLRIYCISQ